MNVIMHRWIDFTGSLTHLLVLSQDGEHRRAYFGVKAWMQVKKTDWKITGPLSSST
jgi:hypothetical protein